MTEPVGSLRPLKGSALHQRQLINTSTFSLLAPYILPDDLLIPTHRRDQINPDPKALPRIAPLPPLNRLLLSWFLRRVMLGGSHRGDTMSFPEAHSRNCQTGLVSPAKLGGFQFLLRPANVTQRLLRVVSSQSFLSIRPWRTWRTSTTSLLIRYSAR